MIIKNGQIILDSAPEKPKKITGTRLASILGVDKWNTEFKTWCAITKTYEEPFEGNKYTEAGKILEPKIIDFLRENVFFSKTSVISPVEVWGKDFFKETYGDFFKSEPIFGGMWDALITRDGTSEGATAVIEIKTTKRAEDWRDGVPENYLLQGE